MSRIAYAQNDAELSDQLRREGYWEGGQRLVRNAYDLTVQLYSRLFTGRGRSQIAHVVGTASILCSLHVPAEAVAAALIHNVYENGDFGDGETGVTDARRARVAGAVGARVEDYVRRFPEIKVAATAAATSARDLDPIDRHVLLIAVAECFEHGTHREWMPLSTSLMAAHAVRLGYPSLAEEVRRAFEAA